MEIFSITKNANLRSDACILFATNITNYYLIFINSKLYFYMPQVGKSILYQINESIAFLSIKILTKELFFHKNVSLCVTAHSKFTIKESKLFQDTFK